MLHCNANTNFFCELHLKSDTVAQVFKFSQVEIIHLVRVLCESCVNISTILERKAQDNDVFEHGF